MKKFKVWSFSHQCLEWRISWFLNFEYWVYVHINGNIVYIIHSAKIFANPTLYLNLTSSKHSISTKIVIMLFTFILSSLLNPIVEKISSNLPSPDSSFSFRFYKNHSLLFFYWSIAFMYCNSIDFYSSHLDALMNCILRTNSPFLFCIEDGMH